MDDLAPDDRQRDLRSDDRCRPVGEDIAVEDDEIGVRSHL